MGTWCRSSVGISARLGIEQGLVRRGEACTEGRPGSLGGVCSGRAATLAGLGRRRCGVVVLAGCQQGGPPIQTSQQTNIRTYRHADRHTDKQTDGRTTYIHDLPYIRIQKIHALRYFTLPYLTVPCPTPPYLSSAQISYHTSPHLMPCLALAVYYLPGFRCITRRYCRLAVFDGFRVMPTVCENLPLYAHFCTRHHDVFCTIT